MLYGTLPTNLLLFVKVQTILTMLSDGKSLPITPSIGISSQRGSSESLLARLLASDWAIDSRMCACVIVGISLSQGLQ